MASKFLQNVGDIREQGFDEQAIRSVAGITHLGGADTVSMIGWTHSGFQNSKIAHRPTAC